MKIDTRARWVHKIPRDELDSLVRRLTTKQDSGIRKILKVAEPHELWTVVAYHRKKAVAWLVLECRTQCYAQVYVKKDYRGCGIGSLLMQRAARMARKRRQKLLVAQLDRSWGFFRRIGETLRIFRHPMKTSERPIPVLQT